MSNFEKKCKILIFLAKNSLKNAEIFKNDKTTNQYFHAISEEHVMDMIDDGCEPDLVSEKWK